MIRTTLVALAIFTLPAFATAQTLADNPPLDRVDDWIAKGVDAENAGDFEKAAGWYLRAAAFDAELSRYLRFRAATALQRAGGHSERVAKLSAGAVRWGYDGAALLAVTSESIPSEETLRAAVETDDREDVCTHLGALASDSSIELPAYVADVHHGWCSGPDVPSLAVERGIEPSPESRITLTERLYGMVEYTRGLAELDQVGELAKLAPLELKCRAMFISARSLYRLRKRRSESSPMYERTADACRDGSVRSYRKRSLYAIGKRAWDLGDEATTKKSFAAVLDEFPKTSHADDALFYLARVAREEGDRETELALMRRAVAEYPDGDMLGEIVWETLEPLYREKKYREFVDAVAALDLPEHDDQYYSQGRLEYFVGMSLAALKDSEGAAGSWSRAWTQYPWSFYGYMSRMRIVAAGGAPPPLDSPPVGARPVWLDGPRWNAGGLGRLSERSIEFAAAYAGTVAQKSDDDRWRVAYVYDRAGRYPVSHNIVRRRIAGRPWGEPLDARGVQWSLAWPDPFGELVEAAVVAETEQAGERHVLPGLARAIMREESSFIPDIESYAGALGLMQLMPRTALGHDDDIDGAATPERLRTPDVNVRVGVDHLFWLGKRWDGHPLLIVASYNAGSGAVSSWLRTLANDDPALFIEDIPRLQTRDYTKRVIGSYAAYEWLYGEKVLDPAVLEPARK